MEKIRIIEEEAKARHAQYVQNEIARILAPFNAQQALLSRAEKELNDAMDLAETDEDCWAAHETFMQQTTPEALAAAAKNCF